MTMKPETACRMSTEQINRAIENIARELDALVADQHDMLMNETTSDLDNINRALDNIDSELFDALLADQPVLINERERRMSAIRRNGAT